MKNKEISNISYHVRNKLKRLHKDKLYDYSVFGDIPKEKKVAFRKAISRLSKKGDIVKVGYGKFYKRDRRPSMPKESIQIDARRKEWLKAGKVPVENLKYRLSRNLFWSNPKGKVPVENVIATVIEKGALDDLDFIRFSLGDNKVREVFLKHFDIDSKPMIREILNV